MAARRDLFGRMTAAAYRTPEREMQMQIDLVHLLHRCLRPDVIMRHVPNGELRDKRTASKLKAMGVLPGSADLEFFFKRYWEDSEGSHTAFAALFLELKLPGVAA